jgi:hypothetical protein
MPRSESAESLSSLFSNRRSNVGGGRATDFMANQGGGAGAAAPSSGSAAAPITHHQSTAQQPQQGQGGASFREQEERIQLKSLVIQRELTETSCIAYAFALEKPRKLRLGICVNESSEFIVGII